MNKLRVRISQAGRKLWRGLREWSGDRAYERYVRSNAARCAAAPMSREKFYVDQLNRRYSRPNRCC